LSRVGVTSALFDIASRQLSKICELSIGFLPGLSSRGFRGFVSDPRALVGNGAREIVSA